MVVKKRYCIVPSCKNSLGTQETTTVMLRAPANISSNATIVRKWKEVLKINNIRGLICANHFNDEDKFVTKLGYYRLKDSAIPRKVEHSERGESENIPSKQTKGCHNCFKSKEERDTLHKQITKLTFDHKIEISRLKEQLKQHEMRHKLAKETEWKLKRNLRKLKKEKEKMPHYSEAIKMGRSIKTVLAEKSKDSNVIEIINCLVNGLQPGQSYPPSFREFCMSIHYHSPRSLEFIRKQFDKNVPSARTIRAWYANSNVCGNPGISNNSLDVLKKIVADAEHDDPFLCSLSFDEIHIRKSLQYDAHSKKFIGRITYGIDKKAEEIPIANQAIVFMLCAVNNFIEIPVAYHLVQTLNSLDRRNLILEVISALTNINVHVMNITFDGLPSNFTACGLLGANLDISSVDFKPYFLNPTNGRKIYIMLDPSHMQKLVRNTLSNRACLSDRENGEIKWQYFVDLVKLKNVGYDGMHKLTKKHIEVARNKMKVGLATQTLSASVADAMEFLRINNVTQFEDSEPTIRFVRFFNDLFDIFNTRHSRSTNIYKRALSPNNKRVVYARLHECAEYLQQLEIGRVDKPSLMPLIKSRNRTGFKGYLIDIASLKLMYEEYVEERKLLKEIPTFAFSQDHVELFFGKIRSQHGCNDNPTTLQFLGAYRKILVNIRMVCTEKGNCREANFRTLGSFSDVYFVSSRKTITDTEHENPSSVTQELSDEADQILCRLEELESSAMLDPILHSASIAHMASLIESKIKSPLHSYCAQCKEVFRQNEKMEDNIFTSKKFEKPCISTFKICKVTNAVFDLYTPQTPQLPFKFNAIYLATFKSINYEEAYEYGFEEHSEHRYYLIKTVVNEFITMKLTRLARHTTNVSQKEFFRHQARKLVHFAGQ